MYKRRTGDASGKPLFKAFKRPRMIGAASAGSAPAAGENKNVDNVQNKISANTEVKPKKKPIVRRPGAFRLPRRNTQPFKAPGGSNGPATSSAAKPTSVPRAVPGTATMAAVYYTVLYTKWSKKKKKTWHDGVLIFTPKKKCRMLDMGGKDVARCSTQFSVLAVGSEIAVGRYDVELVKTIDESEYTSGRVFMDVAQVSGNRLANVAASSSIKASKPFALPSGKNGLRPEGIKKKVDEIKPVHDPNAPNALPLSQGVPGKTVPVVVSPFLCEFLRPHQRDGVKFMYDCVSGKSARGGCLLCDEMGLGKTLQSITLVWTLLKQGPRGKPSIRRALIVTPSSLVQNWAKEFVKWLGKTRCDPIVITKQGKEAKGLVEDFTHGSARVRPVMIISYEMTTKYIDVIRKADVGLLVCDEAHRLKNSAGNKTINALRSIATPRKVLLTGTPIQNKLSEFFAMADFCNPSILQDLATFKRVYQIPIEKGRDKRASQEEKRLGEERSAQLAEFTRAFVLRRTADLLKAFLPPKVNLAVFCKLSPEQDALYRHITAAPKVKRYTRSGHHKAAHASEGPLVIIQHLTKLCSHPELLKDRYLPRNEDEGELDKFGRRGRRDPDESYFVGTKNIVDAHREDLYRSGKFYVLSQLLQRVRDAPEKDRFVLVSQSTKTLKLMADLCKSKKWSYMQLDGSTPQAERQGLVDNFNSPSFDCFVFLLSARAGGAGLNLIGANRLVLFDPSWNPAIDEQAMARIWRDGQKKHVFIYRLLSTGTVEERVYQRQILKQEYSAAVVDVNKTKAGSSNQLGPDRNFSHDELKQLFLPPKDTRCHTYDLISNMKGVDEEYRTNAFKNYTGPEDIDDDVLKAAVETSLRDVVTFVHTKVGKK